MKITAWNREKFEVGFASGCLGRLDLSRLPGRPSKDKTRPEVGMQGGGRITVTLPTYLLPRCKI